MEDPQRSAVAGNHRRNRFVRTIQRPGGAEIANFLVAVRVAEHDLLDSTSAI
jgi:hypothetical protein